MLRKCFAVFAVAGLLMLVGQLSAEEKNATAHEGKVVKAADGKLTITDKDDKEHVATVAADAKITCDGKECKLEDLKKDIKVKVTCKKDGEKFTALKIEAKTK